MRIISFLTLPSTVERILLHLDLPHRPPRVSPARGPPQAELELDQSPAFDLAAPEPIPELPSLRSGEPAGYLFCSSSRGSARTGSSSISPRPMTEMPEARMRPRPPPPRPLRTTLPSSAHPTILRAPIPMATYPPRTTAALRHLPGSRPPPPSPTLRQLAPPDPAPYLASAPRRAFGFVSGQLFFDASSSLFGS